MGNNETREQLAEYCTRLIEGEAWADTGEEAAAHIHRELGWQPPARVINTAEGMDGFTDGADAVAALDALPEGSIIRVGKVAHQRLSHWWNLPGSEDVTDSVTLVEDADGADIVVLWEPEEAGR